MTESQSAVAFGAMRSIAHNIGEEIQWLAQERFLPRVDTLFFRDRLSRRHPKCPTKVIMNGWYTNRGDRFLPHKMVEPLLISMYIHPQCRDRFAKGKIRNFLIENGPVGCRDRDTEAYLNREGIPAYFSGCLTLTLQRNPNITGGGGYIIASGLTDAQFEVLQRKAEGRERIIRMDRLVPQIFSISRRMEIAKAILAFYQNAKCIVTNKLHAALPALALETPVLLIEIDPHDSINDPERLSGNKELCHHIAPDDFVRGMWDYPLHCPPANPPFYKTLREDLIRRCEAFTGYNREESLLDIEDPEAYFVGLLTDPKNYLSEYWRTLYHMPCSTLLRNAYRRLIRRKTYLDLTEASWMR